MSVIRTPHPDNSDHFTPTTVTTIHLAQLDTPPFEQGDWWYFTLYVEDLGGGFHVAFRARERHDESVEVINAAFTASHAPDGDLFDAAVQASAHLWEPYLL